MVTHRGYRRLPKFRSSAMQLLRCPKRRSHLATICRTRMYAVTLVVLPMCDVTSMRSVVRFEQTPFRWFTPSVISLRSRSRDLGRDHVLHLCLARNCAETPSEVWFHEYGERFHSKIKEEMRIGADKHEKTCLCYDIWLLYIDINPFIIYQLCMVKRKMSFRTNRLWCQRCGNTSPLWISVFINTDLSPTARGRTMNMEWICLLTTKAINRTPSAYLHRSYASNIYTGWVSVEPSHAYSIITVEWVNWTIIFSP